MAGNEISIQFHILSWWVEGGSGGDGRVVMGGESGGVTINLHLVVYLVKFFGFSKYLFFSWFESLTLVNVLCDNIDAIKLVLSLVFHEKLNILN